MAEYIELIDKYRIVQSKDTDYNPPSYDWVDNTGEIVRCKDCDCWNDWDSAGRESLGNYVCSCAYWSVEDGPVFYTRPTDFCSYGEKREES